MFQVKAFRKSVITSGYSEWILTAQHNGYVFVNKDTGYVEMGSYSEDPNKFECLNLFKKLSGDMEVRFELI